MKGLLTYKTFLCSLNKHIPKPYHRLGNNSAVYGALRALPKIGLSTADKLIHVIPNMFQCIDTEASAVYNEDKSV